jgi:hypothetical protein
MLPKAAADRRIGDMIPHRPRADSLDPLRLPSGSTQERFVEVGMTDGEACTEAAEENRCIACQEGPATIPVRMTDGVMVSVCAACWSSIRQG